MFYRPWMKHRNGESLIFSSMIYRNLSRLDVSHHPNEKSPFSLRKPHDVCSFNHVFLVFLDHHRMTKNGKSPMNGGFFPLAEASDFPASHVGFPEAKHVIYYPMIIPGIFLRFSHSDLMIPVLSCIIPSNDGCLGSYNQKVYCRWT